MSPGRVVVGPSSPGLPGTLGVGRFSVSLIVSLPFVVRRSWLVLSLMRPSRPSGGFAGTRHLFGLLSCAGGPVSVSRRAPPLPLLTLPVVERGLLYHPHVHRDADAAVGGGPRASEVGLDERRRGVLRRCVVGRQRSFG